MKVVWSSPLRTGRLYPQEYSGTHFLEAESTPGRMVPLVGTEKIPSDNTGIDPETLLQAANKQERKIYFIRHFRVGLLCSVLPINHENSNQIHFSSVDLVIPYSSTQR